MEGPMWGKETERHTPGRGKVDHRATKRPGGNNLNPEEPAAAG